MFEAYATPEFADEYFAAVGNAVWPATPAEPDPQYAIILNRKKAALLKATLWIDNIGLGKWKGSKASPTQELAWPRAGVSPEEGVVLDSAIVPNKVKFAACEAALRIIRGVDMEPDQKRGGKVKQEVIGPISKTFMDDAPAGTRFTAIENFLSGFLNSPLFETSSSGKAFNGSVKMIRA